MASCSAIQESRFMVAYSALSLTPIVDDQGRPVVGARIEIFDAGTLTPKAAYKDKALNTPHPRPILTSAGGRIPSIWTTGNDYRARITTPAGSLIDDIDGIQGDVVTVTVGGGGGGGTSPIETGDAVWSYRTGTRAGWVRMNARTIGSATSGATERANVDCHDLFVFLWNGDPNLAVSGGRGGTAETDWAANKTIALPDARFRVPVGLDDMGNTAAGRSVGATFGTGAGTTLGSVGGTAGETLLTSQIPSHSHTGTTNDGGSHQHTGATSTTGAHSHGFGSTGGAGSHSHTGFYGIPNTYSGVASSGGAGGYWNGGPGSFGSASTSTDGLHSHTIDFAGDHSHTFTTDAAGLHAHAFTSSPTGGGLVHNNMSPFILGTWYMKL